VVAMKKKNTGRKIFSYLVPVIVLGYVLNKIEFHDLRVALKNLSVKWYVSGFVIYTCNQMMRTLRFLVLLPKKSLSFHRLFQIQASYIFLSYFLPFKSGELSYPLFIKKYSTNSVTEGLSSLFISRAFDLLTLLVFWIALYTVRDRVFVTALDIRSPLKPIVIVSLILFALLLLILFVLPKVLDKTKHPSHPFRSFLVQTIEGLRVIRKMTSILLLALLSFLMFGFIFWSFALIVRSIGYSVGLWQTVTISLFALLGRLVQGVGNFGSHEAAWTGALLLVGFSEKEALVIALSSHFIIISYILILAAFSYLPLKMSYPREDS
jgi:hypothetical protein